MAKSKKETAKVKNSKLSKSMEGNQNALGNEGGRPPIYATPEELQAKCDDYFEWVKGESHSEKRTLTHKDGSIEEQEVNVWDRVPEPLTVTGLALHLGFCSRSTLDDYENKPEFSYIIKRARARVENGYEKALHAQSPTGAIFALKNMGWKDKTEVDSNNVNKNFNYTSEPLTPEKIRQIHEALQNDY